MALKTGIQSCFEYSDASNNVFPPARPFQSCELVWNLLGVLDYCGICSHLFKSDEFAYAAYTDSLQKYSNVIRGDRKKRYYGILRGAATSCCIVLDRLLRNMFDQPEYES